MYLDRYHLLQTIAKMHFDCFAATVESKSIHYLVPSSHHNYELGFPPAPHQIRKQIN